MNDTAPIPVVGIGASADCLCALEDFFKSLPANPGMAFVVITHVAPDHQSFLVEIPARRAGPPVQAASDDQKVEANRVYVLPSSASPTIVGRRQNLHETESGRRDSKPVDIFFASLAQDCEDYAVGVILSRGGHDGVLGVKSIKEHGGLAPAGDSSGPVFAGTPDSAIARGLVDFAIPVDAMAAKRIESAGSCKKLHALAKAQKSGEDEDATRDAREAICQILHAKTGHDFSSYKTRTFLRRVQRRMEIKHCGPSPIMSPCRGEGEIEHCHSGVVTFDFAETGLSARLEIPPPPELEPPL